MSILEPDQYKNIYNVSFLALGSCAYAAYKGHYILSICPGGVFLTSINYWYYPDYSWRRYLDMTYVSLALFYQLYKAYGAQYGTFLFTYDCCGKYVPIGEILL